MPLSSLIRDLHDRDVRLNERLQRTLLSSSFWSTNAIRNAIRSRAHLTRGELLDVGCGRKPYATFFAPFVARYVGLEYSSDAGYRGNTADIFGDAMALPVADASYDSVLCTEVLEHVGRPDLVVHEIARVLRPGGVALITAPFLYPVHDTFDYFRYTASGMRELVERAGLKIEEIAPLAGGGLTMATLVNVYWFEAGFMWTKWLWPLSIPLRPILLVGVAAVNVIGGVVHLFVRAPQYPINHIVVARKAER